MQLSDLKYAFYALSPTFLSSALILMLLLLFAIASLLINTISYSKIAVIHMLIFIFSAFYIPALPVAVSVDILLLTFILFSIVKIVGKFFSEFGRSEYVEKIIKLSLAFACLAILQDVVFAEADFGFSAMAQSSVVVGSLRRFLVDVGVGYGVAAEMLASG
jgi:hypothetical protein